MRRSRRGIGWEMSSCGFVARRSAGLRIDDNQRGAVQSADAETPLKLANFFAAHQGYVCSRPKPAITEFARNRPCLCGWLCSGSSVNPVARSMIAMAAWFRDDQRPVGRSFHQPMNINAHESATCSRKTLRCWARAGPSNSATASLKFRSFAMPLNRSGRQIPAISSLESHQRSMRC